MEQNAQASQRHFLQLATDLFNRNTDLLSQMTELRQLRNAVQLAEAAKTERQSGASRRRANPKVISPPAGLQLSA